ncbi:MAG: hypothetical protein H7323_07505 [Frankiales bacterium]|nr:hypothetical protein [Frankiales bacterium]
MPTIQIRDVPEDVHRAYRRRAAEAGMSLQEFLLSELVARGRGRTPAEVVAEVRQQMAAREGRGYSAISSVSDVRADRDSR